MAVRIVALVLASVAALPALAAAPQIEHRPPPLLVGEPFRVRARVSGATEVFRPRLYWRNVGERAWNDVPLKAQGEHLVAEVPAAEIKADIEYYLQAFDKDDIASEGTFASRDAPHRLALRRPAAPRRPAATAVTAEAPRTRPMAAVAVLAAAVVAAGAGTALGLSARSAAGEIQAAPTPAEFTSRADRAQSLSRGATAAWVTAALLGAAGAGLLVWKF